MKRLLIEVDAQDNTCWSCRALQTWFPPSAWDTGKYYCRLFDCALGKTPNGVADRCPECLAAEQAAKGDKR